MGGEFYAALAVFPNAWRSEAVVGIRDDGQAGPSLDRAATPPVCRPARKPRSALVPAALCVERVVRTVAVTGVAGRGLTLPASRVHGSCWAADSGDSVRRGGLWQLALRNRTICNLRC
jgi:hypothetical protein